MGRTTTVQCKPGATPWWRAQHLLHKAVGQLTPYSVEFSIMVTAQDPNAVITVADAGGTPVVGTVTQESGTVFVFTPDAPFAPGTYTATAFNVEQTAPMVNPFTWSLTVQ